MAAVLDIHIAQAGDITRLQPLTHARHAPANGLGIARLADERVAPLKHAYPARAARHGCGKGKVAILEGIAGSSSAIDREEGFVAALEGTGIEVVSSLTANYSREEGATVTEDVLQANPELNAIYAHNDEMALGAVRAVAAAGRSAEIKIYGIDATDDALAAVESGEMAATVQQQPDVQIQIALENAVKYLGGETLEPLVNIPLKLIVKQ